MKKTIFFVSLLLSNMSYANEEPVGIRQAEEQCVEQLDGVDADQSPNESSILDELNAESTQELQDDVWRMLDSLPCQKEPTYYEWLSDSCSLVYNTTASLFDRQKPYGVNTEHAAALWDIALKYVGLRSSFMSEQKKDASESLAT